MSPTNAPGLPILISVPTTDASLVSRYEIRSGYILNDDPNQKVSGGEGTIDHRGGTFQGNIQPNAAGGFTKTVDVDVSVEYTAASEVSKLLWSRPLQVDSSGVKYSFELAEFSVFVDLPHHITQGDLFAIKWSYISGGKVITTGHKLIKDQAILDSIAGTLAGPFLMAFIADPTPVTTESFHLEIEGKYYSKPVPKFTKDFLLSQRTINLLLKDDAAGGGSHFESA